MFLTDEGTCAFTVIVTPELNVETFQTCLVLSLSVTLTETFFRLLLKKSEATVNLHVTVMMSRPTITSLAVLAPMTTSTIFHTRPINANLQLNAS